MQTNTFRGKVIAFSEETTITGRDTSKEPMRKRKLLLDCTYHDEFGNAGKKNTPLLEFGGKALDALNELINGGLKKDDIVEISFVIQGREYEKDGKRGVFTSVYPLDITLIKSVETQQPVNTPTPAPQQPAPAAAPTQEENPHQGSNALPF